MKPDWANYLKTDDDGVKVWFENKPYKSIYGCWLCNSGKRMTVTTNN